MSHQDPEKLEALFEQASQLPEAERQAFLAQLREKDPRLANSLEDLVSAGVSKPPVLPNDPGASEPKRTAAELPEVESWFLASIAKLFGHDSNPQVTLKGAKGDPDAPWTRLAKLSTQSSAGSRYVLRGEIGRGGVGAILKVFDTDLRRHIAMKVILGTEQGESGETTEIDPPKLARFLEEAQVTGQLDHPGVVPVHELGIDPDGRVYFTMRLVKGREFREIIDLVHEGSEEWTLPRALGVLLKVCEAMAFAHDKGVVHRDLKPSNVMVGRYGEVYVMDWGLARVEGQRGSHDIRLRSSKAPLSEVLTDRKDTRESDMDSPLVTMDGAIVGTPFYMPPEQAEGRVEEVGPRSDVYAVGAMLYHLLTGRMPYHTPGSRPSPHAILAAVMQGSPRPIHEFAEVPVELQAICEKAMARDPSSRYADISALGADLTSFLELRVVLAHETGAWAEARKWIQRNRTLAAAVGVAVVAITMVLGFSSAVLAGKNVELERANRNLGRSAEDLVRINADLASALASESAALEQVQAARGEAEDALDHARWQSYLANIRAATLHFDEGSSVEMQRFLEACPQESRAWEWDHMNLESDLCQAALLGHAEGISKVAISPEGKLIASTGREERTLRVWSVDADEEVGILSGDGERLAPAAVDDDGRVIVAKSTDRQALWIWDAAANRDVAVLRSEGASFSAATWSPDGSQIASGTNDGTLRVWDAELGEPTADLRKHDGPIVLLRFSDDGRNLFSGSPGEVRAWDASSGVEVGVLYQGDLVPIAASSGGERLFLIPERPASDLEIDLTLWDTSSASGRSTPLPLGFERWRPSAAFGPRGERAVVGIGNSVCIWDTGTGEELVRLRGHETLIRSVFLSTDGRRITSVGFDGTVRVWNAETGPASVSLRAHHLEARGVAVSPDGCYFASGGGGQAYQGIAYVGYSSVRVWDAVSGDLVHDLGGHGGSNPVNTVVFSPDGKRLASGADNGLVIVWDMETGAKLVQLEGHKGSTVYSIVFSPDGNQLYSALGPLGISSETPPAHTTIRAWDAHSGEALATLQHESAVTAVAIDSNGRWLASGTGDASIHVWKRETGEELFVLRGHEERINCLAFNPEGTHLVSCSRDLTVRIWDLDTAESTVLRGHKFPVTSVAVSPDGRRIASVSQSLRLWSMRTGDDVAVFENDGVLAGVAFDPSGRRLVTTSMDGLLRVWESDRDAASAMWHGASLRRRARAVIEPLFDELFFKDRVVEHLEADGALDEDLKRSAMLLVRARDDVWPGELNARAWPLVDPDRGRQDTDVALGLRLARAEVSRSRSAWVPPRNQAQFRDTLAWALYANALYDRAIAESEKALELAPDENKDEFRGYLERMCAMVDER